MCFIDAEIPLRFVIWVKECITNLKYPIALNGSMVGYFEGGKGLMTQDKGKQQKFDLENQEQIWYSLGFEELGLGFGGEQARK